MRALIQRVHNASVLVEQSPICQISSGMCVFLGIHHQDDDTIQTWMIEKLVSLRIFEDSNQKMNLNINDISGDILVVSQFTLYGDCTKGRRPNFMQAAAPDMAEKRYNQFLTKLKLKYQNVQSGQFGAMMDIHLVNNGPVTLMVER